MKKILKSIIVVTIMFLSINIVKAASATISMSGNGTTIVGNNVTVTVTLSSSDALGSWDFSIGYDTSLLRLTNSTAEKMQRSVGYAQSASQTSKSYTFTFTTLKSGSASVYVNSAEVYGFDESVMSVNKGSKTITIKTQAQIEASYSKDNYLKSLSVEGYDLSPSFDKETLEYTLNLDSNIESVKVIAIKSDSSASVEGDGEISLSEGSNQVTIVVTAENGSKRTYTININVKEVNPIIVKVDGEEYTLIKRKSLLEIPDNFKETIVVINEEEIPALYNEITKYTLVGLKDKDGTVKLYIYDLDSGKYTIYQELSFNSNKLFMLDAPYVPSGLIETTIKINDDDVVAYKFNNNDVYYIIYGMNLNTGNKDFYMYDSEELTIQRYDTTMLNTITKQKDKYLSIVIVLSCVCFLSMLFLLIEVNRDNKREN